MAKWPDGSLKWLACAAVFCPEDGNNFTLVYGKGPEVIKPVKVEQIGIEVYRRVSTGVINVDVGDRGTALIHEVSTPGKKIENKGACGFYDGDGRRILIGTLNLVALSKMITGNIYRTQKSLGVIEKLTVEQSGPIRAVLKLEGKHRRQD